MSWQFFAELESIRREQMGTLSIKAEAELRHVLAHMYYAIEASAKGHRAETLYELKSIEGLIFWEDDDDMTKEIEKMARKKDCRKKNCKGKRK